MHINSSLKSFIENTAQGTPTPGGGSVAALVGSLGAALLCMVGNFTVGKPKFESVEESAEEILGETKKLRDELSLLMEEDIEAYKRFSQASHMPKDTPLMREKRTQVLQKALKEAAEVPLRIVQASFQVIELGERLLPLGNPNLITDIGVGVLLAEASLKSAALNVRVNLSYIKDEEYKIEKDKILGEFSFQASKIKNTILKEVEKRIARQ